MLKRTLFCTVIFLGACSYVSAAEMALAKPACHLTRLPVELVAKICEHIFFLVPPAPTVDEETGTPLSQEEIESYRCGSTLLCRLAVANPKNIVNFLRSNKRLATYLICPQFTELLLRLLLKIEDKKSICFDSTKPEFRLRSLEYAMDNDADLLFMIVIPCFRTIGVRQWMRNLLVSDQNARKVLAKHVNSPGYLEDPQFLINIGFSFNTESDNPTYLMGLLSAISYYPKCHAKKLFKTLTFLFGKDVAINAKHDGETAIFKAVLTLNRLEGWKRIFMEYVILLVLLKFPDFNYRIRCAGHMDLATEAYSVELAADFIELLKSRNETLLKDAILARQPQIKELLDIDPIPL